MWRDLVKNGARIVWSKWNSTTIREGEKKNRTRGTIQIINEIQ